MIGDPPSESGAKNDTNARPAVDGLARIAVGTPGAVCTSTGSDVSDGRLEPKALIACATQKYSAPAVNDVTVIGEAVPVARRLTPVGELHTAAKPVIGDPPSAVGATNETVTRPDPAATAVTPNGDAGAPVTVNGADGNDAGLVPARFVALTRHR